MPDMSEKLICEIQLQAAPCGQLVISPDHCHGRILDTSYQTHRFCGSIRSLAGHSNNITADPRKVLSLLLSKGVKILGVRLLNPPESDAGFAYFRSIEVVKWRTRNFFPHTHLEIRVSRAVWESLDFYVDGATKLPKLIDYELCQLQRR